MGKTSRKTTDDPDRYRWIFDHSAVSMWEQDISRLRARISALRESGVEHLPEYMDAHPQFVEEAMRSIEVVGVNDATLSLFEASCKEALLGPLNATLDTAAGLPAFKELIVAIAEGREVLETVSSARTLRGRKIDVIIRRSIPREDDAVPLMLVSVIDITERKYLERKLEEEMTLLLTLIDINPDHLFIKDREGRFVMVNRAFTSMVGAADQADILGKTDFDIYPADMAERHRAADTRVAESRQPLLNIEERFIGPTGEERCLLVSKVPITAGDGGVIGIIGTARDITEHRRAESALRESEEHYRSMFANAPFGIFHSTLEGTLINANPACAAMFGYKSPGQLIEEVNRKGIAAALYESPDKRREIVDATREGTEWRHSEGRFKRRDGRLIDAIMNLRRYTRPDGATELQGFLEDVTERTRASEALFRQRTFLTTLMDSIPDHIYFKDARSRFILVNAAQANAFHLKDPTEALGRTDFDFFTPEHARAAFQDEQRIIGTGQPMVDVVEKETWPDRPDTWVSTTKMPMRDEKGSIIGTFGVSRDITDRVRMEAALQASKEYAENLIATANVMVVVMDTEWRITTFNATAEQVTGYTVTELAGRNWMEMMMPREKYPEVWERLDQYSRSALPRHIEAPLVTRRGEERYIVWQNNEVREQGRTVGFIFFGMDITERRQIETRNILLATLVESVPDAIIGADSKGIITSWNKGAERIYGYAAGEVIGGPVSVLLPLDFQETLRAIRGKIYDGESVENVDTVFKAKDGKPINVLLTASPIRDANGAIIGTATVSRDVSAQKALQAQIIRAQRLESLATLAGGIAHQFNNINTVVKGYLDLLLSEKGLPDTARSYAMDMLASVDRAVDITERLQGLTRSAPTSADRVHLADLLRSFLPVLEKQFEAQGATLDVELAANPVVTANPSLLHFVVTSMLTNALHALLDRPRRVASMRSLYMSGFAMLEVTDTGCGIPAENLPRIFTPFFTTKGEWAEAGSAQVRVKGVGLSLAVCQSTVAEYGGWIEVESEPGVGSRFRVYLPGEPG
jgi:PAS domain S-box-containing protein